jgi:hypothetical protein
MQADEAFTELLVDQGIDALKAGNKDRAYELLVQAIQNHQHNERAWLWLSGSVADPAERRYCLQCSLAPFTNRSVFARASDRSVQPPG